MHAVNLRAFGPAGNLVYETVADPAPGPGQLRIAVRAAGVHRLDLTLRAGDGDGLHTPLPQLPTIPGREVAGVVDGVGDGVPADWLHRRVVAHLGLANGGYAELAVREAAAVHPIPDGLGDTAAVAMISAGRTALGVLHVAPVTADDVVLITGAADGVGPLLVQAARNAGAAVVATTAGSGAADRTRVLGPRTVDHRQPHWPDEARALLDGQDATVVFDGVGGDVGRRALQLLRLGGHFVIHGWSSGTMTDVTPRDLLDGLLTATIALGPRLTNTPGGLRTFEQRALIGAAAGELSSPVHEFPLSEASAAHTFLATDQAVGKVVLLP